MTCNVENTAIVFYVITVSDVIVKTNGMANLVTSQRVNILVIMVIVLPQRLVFVSANLDGKEQTVMN